MSDTSSVETAAEIASPPQKLVASWCARLDMAGKREENWRKRAEAVVERYRDEKDRKGQAARFNILWANTETLAGALYNRTPQPDVRRRFRDPDPVAKQAAQIIERALSFEIDNYDFDAMAEQCVQDYLLVGRGQARVRYVPVMSGEEVVGESVRAEYVPWQFYRQGDGTREEKLTWKAYGGMMSRDQLVAQFGEVGKKVTLDGVPDEMRDRPAEEQEYFKQTLVWEIWDRGTGKVIVVAPSYKAGPLKEGPPPINFEHFFPSPAALYSVRTNETLVPIPEYTLYQDQAEEVDALTGRIDKLVETLKLRGVYDASQDALAGLFKAGDNELIPINDWARFAGDGGLDKLIAFAPVEQIAKVVLSLYQQREQTKQIIYEITGISDIVRGATDPRETLGAQQLKGQYANMRMDKRINAVQRFLRDLFRLKAEVIAEQFAPESLKAMTGFQLPDEPLPPAASSPLGGGMPAGPMASLPGQPVVPQVVPSGTPKPSWAEVMALLRQDGPRDFRIDIETDSTIMRDAADEQKTATEFLGGVVQFIGGIAPFVASPANPGAPIPLEAAKSMLLAAARRHKFGRDVEDALNQIGEPGGPGAVPQPPPGPSPEQLQMHAEQQQAQAELQFKAQQSQAELAQEMQIEQMRIASAERIEMAKLQAQQQSEAVAREAGYAHEMQKHAMTTEAAAKPATMVQFSGEEALGAVAQTLQGMAQTQGEGITQALSAMADAVNAILGTQQQQNETLERLTAAIAQVAAPKRAYKDVAGNWHVAPERLN